MTSIRTKLQAAIVTGAIAFLPALARADAAQSSSDARYESMPDHAQAEARSGGETMRSQVEAAATPPDHAQAEARGAADVKAEKQMTPAGIPDHATAE